MSAITLSTQYPGKKEMRQKWLHFSEENYLGQDLVFSVKLQFDKTLVSVQNKIAVQTDFSFRNFWPKTNISSKKNFAFKKFWVQKT